MNRRIDKITLRVITLKLNEPFSTAQGIIQERDHIIIEVTGSGVSGWAEAPALPYPFYNNETVSSTLHCLENIAIPLVMQSQLKSPEEAFVILSSISGNYIARAGLEMALWDFHAKLTEQPLYKILGGNRSQIPAGVSLPQYEDKNKLIEQASAFFNRGYKKIKIKISPGNDISPIETLLRNIPDLPLMADANRSYSIAQMHILKELDAFNLLMIEEPLNGSLNDCAKLQEVLNTPICLDESIPTLNTTKEAINLKSCRIINIKPTRVGGHTAALHISNLCKRNDIPVWCGGMLESGIGRAHNIALASLEHFTIPGDISESKRYFKNDIISPEIQLSHDGWINLSDKPGIGYEVDLDLIQKITSKIKTFVK